MATPSLALVLAIILTSLITPSHALPDDRNHRTIYEEIKIVRVNRNQRVEVLFFFNFPHSFVYLFFAPLFFLLSQIPRITILFHRTTPLTTRMYGARRVTL